MTAIPRLPWSFKALSTHHEQLAEWLDDHPDVPRRTAHRVEQRIAAIECLMNNIRPGSVMFGAALLPDDPQDVG